MPENPNYLSEIEREDGTVLTIKDVEARAALADMDPTLDEILGGVNDIKGSLGDVAEAMEVILAGVPTLVEKTITQNGIYDPSDDDADGYSSVTVEVSGGGAGGSDVLFYDYDGSVVVSYSAADFANLSAMPANPTHTGLTAQGWNWSLADAKAYVASYGKLNIGQMYITSDGKTRFYLTLLNNSLTVYLWWIILRDNTTIEIDWGDDSEHTTWNEGETPKTHIYNDAGDYIMTITVIVGSFYMSSSDSDEVTTVRKIEMGNNVTFNEGETFLNFYRLEYITIPKGITEIGRTAFTYCYALKALILPDTLTLIDDMAINGCYSLSVLSIGRGVTSIIYHGISACKSLTSITIPDTVTTLDEGAIDNNNILSVLTIPNSITAFPDNFLNQCDLLTSVIVPENVATIGEAFLKYCVGISSITFKSTTPPTLAANPNLPLYCVIRVPQGTLSDYTSASNYPDPSEYIYEEY